MTANDQPPFRRRLISGSIGNAYLFLPFCMFCHSFSREKEREKGKRDERVLGGLSIIDKAFDEAPLSCEDDSNQEMLLIRLVSAYLTRRRMIGVEFLEIYDRRWRSAIAKSERGILKIETRLDSRCVSARNRMKFYRYPRLPLTINIDEAIVSFLTYWLLCE